MLMWHTTHCCVSGEFPQVPQVQIYCFYTVDVEGKKDQYINQYRIHIKTEWINFCNTNFNYSQYLRTNCWPRFSVLPQVVSTVLEYFPMWRFTFLRVFPHGGDSLNCMQGTRCPKSHAPSLTRYIWRYENRITTKEV